MVTLKALEAAIVQVERIRDLEYSFGASGVEITLRPLRPDEETEVQRYAQVAMDDLADGEGTQAAFADFMDRMRHASLAFALVQIGELDLRDVEYIETGDQDDNGNLVSVPKWEGVRDMIGREWTRTMLSQVFARFGELLERVELRASKNVKFDAVDLEEEITRVERRLTELRAMKEKFEAPPEDDDIQRQQQLVVDVQKAQQRHHDEIRGGPPAPETPTDAQDAGDQVVDTVEGQAAEAPTTRPQPEPPQAPPQNTQGRRSAIPHTGPAPERSGSEAPQEGETAASEEPPQAVDSQNIPLPHEGDSFFDPSDPDQAMEAETHRQAILHKQHLARQQQRKMEAQRREALGVPSEAEQARQMRDAQRESQVPRGATQIDPRTGGLREAANVSDAVFDTGAGRIRSARPQRPAPQAGTAPAPATLHGKPVYKMPTQTLDKPQTAGDGSEKPPTPVRVNPPPGSRNKNFRGPRDG